MRKTRFRMTLTIFKLATIVVGVSASQVTTPQTEMVKDLRPGAESGNPWFLIDFKDALYFTAEDGIAAMQRSDGTEQGTGLFKEFAPDRSGGDPGAFVVAGDKLFFRGTDYEHGTELWVSDGTHEGTVMPKDVWPGKSQGFFGWPIPWVDGVLFGADDGVSGPQYWTSDGTETGTQRFIDSAISFEAKPRNFFPFEDGWLFKSEDLAHGAELWRTDGTQGASELVKDIVPGPTDSFLFGYPEFAKLNDSVVFWVVGATTAELWLSDGTEAGTSVFWVLPETDLIPDFRLISYKNMVLFFLQDSDGDWSLWRTDGTQLGTWVLKEGFIDPVVLSGFLEYNGLLYLSLMTTDRVSGKELWRTDGTKAGTRLFVDLYPGPGSASPSGLTIYAGRMYFAATNGTLGEELYRTDGTVEGTELVADIAPGADSSSPDQLTVSQGALFFDAWEPGSGRELYKTTVPLGPVNLGGRVQLADGTPICAMVLASGQYMFSCNPAGVYSLQDLPREMDGTVTRQVYANGFFPAVDVLAGSTQEHVVMTPARNCPSYNLPYIPDSLPGSAGNRHTISGRVLLQSTDMPICAMVLANGAHMFSCDGSGRYTLEFPLDSKGQFTLQVYADGFAPTVQSFDQFSLGGDVRMARSSECQ